MGVHRWLNKKPDRPCTGKRKIFKKPIRRKELKGNRRRIRPPCGKSKVRAGMKTVIGTQEQSERKG